MTARLIDGTAVARKVREDVARGVEKLLADGGVAPGLATVLIGDDPASEVYVRNKRRLSVEAGMQDLHRHLPGDVDQATTAAPSSTNWPPTRRCPASCCSCPPRSTWTPTR